MNSPERIFLLLPAAVFDIMEKNPQGSVVNNKSGASIRSAAGIYSFFIGKRA